MSSLKLIHKVGLGFLLLGTNAYLFASIPNLSAQELQLNSKKGQTKNTFITEAIKRSGPAVVTIETKRKVTYRQSLFPPNFFLDPSLERFFGQPNFQGPRSSIQRGQGSGVIFAKEGFVLTNAHVVENIDNLVVGLSDGKRVPAEVIGQDSLTDLAVLRISGKGPWPKAPLGDSNNLEVGDWAIAVGNPYGLEKTVTLGIISNLNRNVSKLGISDKKLRLIQTDAAINPGNSGGPLLNSEGEIIGINTLVRSGPGAGLGFAIPINQAIKIANQLVHNGKAIHPMIGVNLAYLMPSNENNELALFGARIINVIPGSPAEIKGLKINDIIIKINGKKVISPEDVVDQINYNGVDQSLEFLIRRGKQNLTLQIRPVDINNFKMN